MQGPSTADKGDLGSPFFFVTRERQHPSHAGNPKGRMTKRITGSPEGKGEVSWRGNKGTAAQRGYGSRWQKARASFLAAHPICVMCKAGGTLTPANVVDHVIPHRGDKNLFWDTANWQSLCARHHNSDKRRMESGKEVRPQIGLDGWPV